MSGFDRAQAHYDAMLPPEYWAEDEDDKDEPTCACGNPLEAPGDDHCEECDYPSTANPLIGAVIDAVEIPFEAEVSDVR